LDLYESKKRKVFRESTRLAPEVVDANTVGTRDGVAYQSLHRADGQSRQRNLPEALFVLLEMKRSAGVSVFCDLSLLIS
jgi:hypothetical protein